MNDSFLRRHFGEVAHTRNTREIGVLGPQCCAREPGGGQDDAIGHRQAEFVCEPRSFECKSGREGNFLPDSSERPRASALSSPRRRSTTRRLQRHKWLERSAGPYRTEFGVNPGVGTLSDVFDPA